MISKILISLIYFIRFFIKLILFYINVDLKNKINKIKINKINKINNNVNINIIIIFKIY